MVSAGRGTREKMGVNLRESDKKSDYPARAESDTFCHYSKSHRLESDTLSENDMTRPKPPFS